MRPGRAESRSSGCEGVTPREHNASLSAMAPWRLLKKNAQSPSLKRSSQASPCFLNSRMWACSLSFPTRPTRESMLASVEHRCSVPRFRSSSDLHAYERANFPYGPVSRLAASIPSVGALAASATLDRAPDRRPVKSGRVSPPRLARRPGRNSTGDKEKFGWMTEQDDRYIRRLLVLCAISVLRAAQKRKGALCDWLGALKARKPPKVVRWCWPTSSPGSSRRSSPWRGLPHLHLRQGLIPIGGNALERGRRVGSLASATMI
jgi:hypothetical protein